MSVAATKIQDLRILDPNFDKNMSRSMEYGALDFFTSQANSGSSLLSQEVKDAAMQSMGTNVTIPVIDYDGDLEVSNVRTCTIEDAENTSAIYTVVFKTYSKGFTMVPDLYKTNSISYDRDFQKKIERTARAIANALDLDAIAMLEANKTQVFKDLLQYSQTGNVIQVPTQMATEILGDIHPIMRTNAYSGQMHIIGNGGIDSLVNKLAQHGVYNDVNKQLEYAGKILHYSTNIANESGKNGTFFAIQDGNVDVLCRTTPMAQRNAVADGHEWSIVKLPYIDLPIESYYYTSVGNQSGIAGAASAHLGCAPKEYFGFSIDVAFVVAYNSDPETVANPIIKAEIAAPAANTPIAMPVYVTNATDFPA